MLLHKLLSHQLRSLTRADGGIDAEALIAVMDRTYNEFDRERRLNDRAAKLMEEELQDANKRVRMLGEQRLAETLESVPSAITLFNADYKVQNLNSAMTALCASMLCPPQKGDDFAEILAALSPQADGAASLGNILSGNSLEMKIADRWYLGALHRMSDGGYALALSDVTPLKEREAAMVMARDAAESANQLKSKFLATMSHELRTPLNAILGFSEVIRDRVFGNGEDAWQKYQDYAGSIHTSGSHLQLLISEILDLSKIESGSYRLYVERFNMADLVQDSLMMVSPQAERGEVTVLPLDVRGDMAVEGDVRAIKQVIVNLLSNAVKFTPPGGEVEISCVEIDGSVHVKVRDTGVGISAEHLSNVFKPFHQGDAEVARRYEGTGLGLSVCRGLVEMHGGTIGLNSAPGLGTLAFFHLPKLCIGTENIDRAA